MILKDASLPFALSLLSLVVILISGSFLISDQVELQAAGIGALAGLTAAGWALLAAWMTFGSLREQIAETEKQTAASARQALEPVSEIIISEVKYCRSVEAIVNDTKELVSIYRTNAAASTDIWVKLISDVEKAIEELDEFSWRQNAGSPLGALQTIVITEQKHLNDALKGERGTLLVQPSSATERQMRETSLNRIETAVCALDNACRPYFQRLADRLIAVNNRMNELLIESVGKIDA